MSLRQLLTYAHENDAVTALADAARAADGPPERAFVSASLRPYLLAALLDEDPQRPALVVAGDDRAARDLAADLKVFLDPRLVRFYPARGVRYESHLTPPPHLEGLRVAALEALARAPGDDGAAVVVASAAALARGGRARADRALRGDRPRAERACRDRGDRGRGRAPRHRRHPSGRPLLRLPLPGPARRARGDRRRRGDRSIPRGPMAGRLD